MSSTLILTGLDGRGRNWMDWLGHALTRAIRLQVSPQAGPDLKRWTHELSAALERIDAPCWLVTRDFGALAALNLPPPHASRLLGLLLVAPAAPEHFGYPPDHLRNAGTPGLVMARTHDSALRLTSAAYLAERSGLRLYRPESAEPDPESPGHWPELLSIFLALQHTHHGMPRGSLMACEDDGNGNGDRTSGLPPRRQNV